jgi:long-chain fatty acid transport protein
MSFNKSKLALAVAAAAGLTFSSGAFATNGIIQAGNGMVAHGMGGAGLSNAGEAAAGMDNPALISQTGDALGIGYSFFMPDRSRRTPAGSFPVVEERSDAHAFAIPQLAYTSAINNTLSGGLMVYAAGGMNTDYGTTGSSVDLSMLFVAPTLSYAFTKDVSVGASLLVVYENFRARGVFDMTGAPGSPPTGYTDESTATGYGVKLGVNAKVANGISVGAVLQPKLSMGEIDSFKTYVDSVANYVTGGAVRYTGDAALTLPNLAGVGAKFAVGKDVDINADLMYYQWTSVDLFKFFGWEDQTVLKVGAEWRTSDKLALRAGFNYGKSPISANKSIIGASGFTAVSANGIFPAVSEMHVTVGLGYKMDKNMAFNAYYLYSPENKVEDAAALGGAMAKMSQHALGLGINYAAK